MTIIIIIIHTHCINIFPIILSSNNTNAFSARTCTTVHKRCCISRQSYALIVQFVINNTNFQNVSNRSSHWDWSIVQPNMTPRYETCDSFIHCNLWYNLKCPTSIHTANPALNSTILLQVIAITIIFWPTTIDQLLKYE